MSNKINQPSDSMSLDGKIKLVWSPSFSSNMNRRFDNVQDVIDNAALRYMIPYMPFDTGAFIKKTVNATVIGSGEIFCPGPEAHYLNEGEVYGPNIPIREGGQIVGFYSPPVKYPTGRPLVYNTTKNPLAGPHFFDRMKADHKEDILKEAQEVANKR